MRKRIAFDSSSNYPIEVMSLTVEEEKQVVRYTKANAAFIRTYGFPMESFNKRTVHRFLLRYFPKTEDDLTSLLYFLKHKKKSYNLRKKAFDWKKNLKALADDFFYEADGWDQRSEIEDALNKKAASEETAYIDNTLD